ncbi:hypothetical protein CDAR_275171 [Caerostris darwini]|uniref:Uncharacterized protein n=1 Tax=Caerostris darwini TaxID=1538125 RepID=A0AAV4VWK1_9ARAC|nr:hypothetical protein CDAR_275171 [Caerostris darwini]
MEHNDKAHILRCQTENEEPSFIMMDGGEKDFYRSIPAGHERAKTNNPSRFSLIKTTSGRGVFFLCKTLKEPEIPGRPLISDSQGFTGNDKSLSMFISRGLPCQRR